MSQTGRQIGWLIISPIATKKCIMFQWLTNCTRFNLAWLFAGSGTTHGGLLLFFRLPFALVHTKSSPSGYWRTAGSPGYVYSAERLVIGMKRTMVFYRGCQPSGIKTKWKIEEFTAFQQATAPEICTIKMVTGFAHIWFSLIYEGTVCHAFMAQLLTSN